LALTSLRLWGAAFMYVLAPMPSLLFGSPQGGGDGYSLLAGGDSGDGCVCFASRALDKSSRPHCKGAGRLLAGSLLSATVHA